MKTALFNRFEISMTKKQAASASHIGRCDEDVLALSKVADIASQLARLDPEHVRAELKEYGAWDAEELADHEKNLQRILWIAAGHVLERRPGI